MGKYVGMGSLFSERIETGGMAFKLVPLDPILPHSRLVEAYRPMMKQLQKIEDPKSYPELSGKLFVFDPGSAIPGELGYTKLWIVLNANGKVWDHETRKSFKDWFREYAELVWSYDGALTGTHGFIPGDMQEEICKKEVGEAEYQFMKEIKRALDPKNIMNPRIRF
jgi:FAD/FMN-containing dehydrogenase